MRKAIHVIRNLDLKHGGTSISVPELLLATAATGRYCNVALSFDETVGERNIGSNSTISTLKWSALRVPLNILFGGEVEDAIRKADVLQIHGLWQQQCITAGVIGRRHRKPIVISAHGMLERWALNNKRWKKGPYSLLVERPNLRSASVLRALTAAEASDYRRFGLRNPIAIIPNGVDPVGGAHPELFFSSWPDLRGRRLVLYLSRIHYKKGVDLLVEAWGRIAPHFTGAHLVIAGPDSEGSRARVEQLVSERSIGDRVTFTGPVYGEMKASLFSAASLFVLPSHSEGFSVAVLESLAAGVPVIITKGCNFPEVATSGAGWIVSPGATEIERALNEALESSQADLHARGQRGLQLVRSNYSWARIGQQMADVFDWALGGSRPSTVEIWN